MRTSQALLAGVVFWGLQFVGAADAAPNYRLIERIAGADGPYDYVAVDAKLDRVFVARGSNVMSVDLAKRKVDGAFASATGAHAALPVNGGDSLLITNGGADNATLIDARTGAVEAVIPTGKNPDAATYDPSTGLVLVMDHTGGDVVLIDPKAQKATATIAVGGKLEAAAVDGAGRAFVNVEDRNEVAVLDIKQAKVTARYKLKACEGPTGIAYAPADKLLIVTCEGVAQAIAADSGKLVASVPIGDGADGVVFEAASKLAFASSGDTGTLSVISVANGTAKLVQTVKTEPGARTIGLDPRTGRLYLPVAKYGPAPAGGGRKPLVPGSFALLVVGK